MTVAGIQFNWSMNLGNAVVSTLLALVIWMLNKLWNLGAVAVLQHNRALIDIDDHAEVINLHTTILVNSGMVKGPIGIPRVEERRHKPRLV